MRAVVMEGFGGTEVLKMRDMPMPEPKPNQIQIRVACASVNPADWKARAGWLKPITQTEWNFPIILGFDAAGIVSKVGAETSRFKVGDRVFGWVAHAMGHWGSYAEYCAVDEENCAHIPAGMDYATAACIPVAGLTGSQALITEDRINLKPGQTILVHGASGGVGSYVVQFAKLMGAKIAATCSTRNIDYVKSLGADFVIDYKMQDIHKELRKWAPEGVDAVLDAVGLLTLPDPLRLLKKGGVYLQIMTTHKSDFEGPTDADAAKLGVRSMLRSMYSSPEHMAQMAKAIVEGKVKVGHMDILPLEKAGEAQSRIEDGHTRGKMVLRVADL